MTVDVEMGLILQFCGFSLGLFPSRTDWVRAERYLRTVQCTVIAHGHDSHQTLALWGNCSSLAWDR